MQNMTLKGPDEGPQPGLESQGRAASMPRLAAETQVCCLGTKLWRGWDVSRGEGLMVSIERGGWVAPG